MRDQWQRGDKAQLAKLADISQPYLQDILTGRRGVSASMAAKIECCAHQLSIGLSRVDLLYPVESTNPLMEAGGKR